MLTLAAYLSNITRLCARNNERVHCNSLNRPFHGPDGRCLEVKGSFKATLEYYGRRANTTVYVLSNVDAPLLSRQAGTQLSIVARLDAVSNANQYIMHLYSRLFRGLGCMNELYRIQLKSDAQPYAVYAPRCIPLPLLPKVKDEIGRLLSVGVIEQVDEPTQWCAPIFVAPKTQGIRLCVDLSRLNESVMHERHILPSVDQMLAQLAGTQVFSILDCYNAFLQIPLAPESRHLTTFLTPFGNIVSVAPPIV